MKITHQQIVDATTSLVYSLIPALLILWFLIARKTKTKVAPPLISFILGATLSSLAGQANHYVSVHVFPGDNSPQFFFSVGIVEESIKFVASALGLFLVSRAYWKSDFQNNWLAHAVAGSLGFAAAENFIYGIDGQGGIARVIPLMAHSCFAVFWGLGAYTASLESKFSKIAKWLSLGLLEGIVLHALYDCVVSENLIQDRYKVLSWIAMLFVVALIVYFHKKVISELENKDSKILQNCIEAKKEQLAEEQETDKPEDKGKKIVFSLLSFLMPGLGHLLKGEFFVSLSYFLLSILGPVLVLRFAVTEITLKFNLSSLNEQKFTEESLKIVLVCLLLYFAVGLWSAWELFQRNEDFLDKKDRKKRLSAYFPISTLFFVSLMMSFFLPAFERQKGKNKEDEKKVVIKEIPLGIVWEVEKTPPAPQKEINTDLETKEQVNSITLQKQPDKKPNKKEKKEKVDPAQNKPPKGVTNSDTSNLDNLPIKLPSTGLIGVQLAEITYNGEARSFITLVYPGTSAERAGLKVGDFILAVNKQTTRGLNAFQVSNMVRGPIGTSVELVLYRAGEGEITTKAYRTGTPLSLEGSSDNLMNPKFNNNNGWSLPKELNDLSK